MALRWKKNPKPKGLARIGCGPQGSSLFDAGKEFARVYPARAQGVVTGWYWVSKADAGVIKNTSANLAETEDLAKAEAMAYVRECLKAQTHVPTSTSLHVKP